MSALAKKKNALFTKLFPNKNQNPFDQSWFWKEENTTSYNVIVAPIHQSKEDR